MQDAIYLGDLGGLSSHRQLIVLDLRGTGRSERPDDASTYRCDRLVDDVESLREHLGLRQLDLLGHSAGANLAVQYVARYPKNVSGLALVTPSARAVGITITGEMRREIAQLRSNEPWFPAAFAAWESIIASGGTDSDWDAMAPFFRGRWDAAARKHQAAEGRQINKEAAAVFNSEESFAPDSTRAALAAFEEPVLLIAGELDMNSPPRSVAEYAALFPDAAFVVQPGAGHFPWLDDPGAFVATMVAFGPPKGLPVRDYSD